MVYFSKNSICAPIIYTGALFILLSYCVPRIQSRDLIRGQQEDAKKENALPADVDGLVFYQLFTRNNPTNRQTLLLNDLPTLINSFFDPKLPVVIYSVGWSSDMRELNRSRDEYLGRENLNFIAVDWEAVAGSVIGTAANTRKATTETGMHLAAFIDFLVKEGGVRINQFHLIGHSAGAHLVGVAGSTVTTGRIQRITGLDPADGGTWDFNDTDTRLDIGDAAFVDIMHVNGGNLMNGEIAFDEVMGHVDFYVNGGHKQPGCPEPDFVCCNHCRAYTYYAESINTDVGFVALRCDNYEDFMAGDCEGNGKELMGAFTPNKARGVYYINTNLESPYAMGDIYN